MVCLGLEPRAVEWKAQTNSLSYGRGPSVNQKQRNSFSVLALPVFEVLDSKSFIGFPVSMTPRYPYHHQLYLSAHDVDVEKTFFDEKNVSPLMNFLISVVVDVVDVFVVHFDVKVGSGSSTNFSHTKSKDANGFSDALTTVTS